MCFYLGLVLVSLKKVGEGLEVYFLDGEVIFCDLVVFVVGLCLCIELVFVVGLVVNCGIVVDCLLCIFYVNIYVLGDCVEVDGFNLFYVMLLMVCVCVLV